MSKMLDVRGLRRFRRVVPPQTLAEVLVPFLDGSEADVLIAHLNHGDRPGEIMAYTKEQAAQQLAKLIQSAQPTITQGALNSLTVNGLNVNIQSGSAIPGSGTTVTVR